jgi:uncharacterized protein
MRSPLSIPLTEVKETGEQPVDVTVPADTFPDVFSEGQLISPIAVTGVIRHVDDNALFEGAATGRWRMDCTRCLAPVEGDWAEKLEVEGPIDSKALDLAEDVRQAVGLAQPMKALCKPDCKGLCPTCRADRNQKDCGHAPTTPSASPDARRPRLTSRHPKG